MNRNGALRTLKLRQPEHEHENDRVDQAQQTTNKDQQNERKTMKSIMKHGALLKGTLLSTLLAGWAIQATAQPVKRTVDAFIVAGLTVDADGNTVIPVVADPDTLLFYRRTGLPILAPDGHQLTAGEFAAVKGTATAKCLRSGTQVKIHVTGLVPHGIYRAWVLTFDEPGFDLTAPDPFEYATGEGALGPNDRSRNTFRASASGEGQITVIHPPGPMSEILPEPPYANVPAPTCLLTGVFEWHVFCTLQQPGQPYGPDVGVPAAFPGTSVEQFVFMFRQ